MTAGDDPDSEGAESSPQFELTNPSSDITAGNWKLKAYNRKVLAGWEALCLRINSNAQFCYNWLVVHPTKPYPRRCYALKHKNYQGAWAFEVGSGDRVYYRPMESDHTVLVYYAGPH